MQFLVPQGSIYGTPCHSKWSSTLFGQDQGDDIVGGPKIYIYDLEISWFGKALHEVHYEFLQDFCPYHSSEEKES